MTQTQLILKHLSGGNEGRDFVGLWRRTTTSISTTHTNNILPKVMNMNVVRRGANKNMVKILSVLNLVRKAKTLRKMFY
jgi:hypothetical protein